MKTTNSFISFLIILILSLFTLTQCDNRPAQKIRQAVKSARNIFVSQNESEKQEWVFNNYKSSVFGLDISHHQGLVDWNKIKYFKNKKEISFVIIRATMGTKRKDNYFTHNWKSLKTKQIIRGAYHYYRPNENSTKQANNYINHVKLQKGDLPPILDIEKISTKQSMKNLKIGLKNWLNIVEKYYGIKPIIYSGDKFYSTHLRTKDFKDYSIWIANYNNIRQPKIPNWSFWQFSEKGNVNGVKEYVDLNVFNGNKRELENLLIK